MSQPTIPMMIKIVTICTILFLLTIASMKFVMNSIVDSQRTYEKFSPEEIAWRKAMRRNLRRPMDKKINL